MEARPTRVHAVELRRQPVQGRVGHGLDPPQREDPGNGSSGSTMASMLRWGLGRPRNGEYLRSWMPAFQPAVFFGSLLLISVFYYLKSA